MARPLRLEYPGALYHLTSRGDGRESIYLDDEDRQGFLSVLTSTVARFNWRLHAYCLMPNHYHLLVETPEANLSRGLRQINGVYAQHLNRRPRRVGARLPGALPAAISPLGAEFSNARGRTPLQYGFFRIDQPSEHNTTYMLTEHTFMLFCV